MGEELTHKLIIIGKNNHLSIFERGIDIDIFNNYMNIAGDWRTEFKEYLENPNNRVPHKMKTEAHNFFLLVGAIEKDFMGYYSSAYLSQTTWKL